MKTPDLLKSPFRKMFSFAGIAIMLSGSMLAQDPQPAPFEPMPTVTVDTNNAIYLPDYSQYPSGPGGHQ